MARMSREFSLVLLGAGLLTAGYFLWPSDDARAADQTADAGGGNGDGSRHSRSYRPGFFFLVTSRSYTSTRTATTSTVSRGGFGRVGVGMSGG